MSGSRRRAPFAAGILWLLNVFAAAQDPVPACGMTRVSLDVNGDTVQGGGIYPEVSANGRYVVFVSKWFPDGTSSTVYKILVRDLQTRTTTFESPTWDGSYLNGDSTRPSISGDGRFVAFESDASNLVPNDTNLKSDIFVRDRLAGITKRVSVDSAGNPSNGGSRAPWISENGRFVTFLSQATNLDPADPVSVEDVYVHDLLSSTTRVASVDSSGVAQGGGFGYVTADGRYSYFSSSSDELVPGDLNSARDVFRHDFHSGLTQLVSVSTTGEQGDSYSQILDLDGSGRFVLFSSSSSNLTPGPGDLPTALYVRDMVAGVTETASWNAAGTLKVRATRGRISEDGRYVAFVSNGTNVVPTNENGDDDVFVHDRHRRTTALISAGIGGVPGNDDSGDSGAWAVSISADGTHVAFSSFATNLFPGPTNGWSHAYLRRNQPTYRSYCAGDGEGSPCPCGNEDMGGVPAGCRNSRGYGGRLEPRGTNCLMPDDLQLQATNLPPGALSMLFESEHAVDPGLGLTFGDGLLCLSLPLRLRGIRVSTPTGTADWGPELGGEADWLAGERRFLQVWYRDEGLSPCGRFVNTTNAIDLPVVP